MYGIFAYIYHTNQLNVGKYTIHGSYGKGNIFVPPDGFAFYNPSTPNTLWEGVFRHPKASGKKTLVEGIGA